MARIHVSLSERHGFATMELAGELDLEAEDHFNAQVRAALDAGVDHLVIDLRALDFMDSTGVRMLLQVDALSRQDGFRLWIVNDPANPAGKVLRLTGLDKVFPIVDRSPELPD